MKEVIRQHIRRYPMMCPCDAVKLLYQSEFGGGHLLTDKNSAVDRLKSELEGIKQTEVFETEQIGGELLRFPLCGIQAAGLSPETVAALFSETCVPSGSRDGFSQKIELLRAMAEAGETPFSSVELDTYLAEYRAAGYPAVSHSQGYKEAYAPAYRLVPIAARDFLPVFARIDALIKEGTPRLVKIEGGSASGKSTLGALLSRIYGASLFHMDDYFLPMAQKTKERLSQPGGNVDYERFLAEVDSIPLNEAVYYRPFSCHEQALMPKITVPPACLRIVEGAYSLHPALKTPDMAVFLDVSPEEQTRRILSRNGREMLLRFQREWIPLETAYFQVCHVKARCDLVFEA